MQRENQKLMDRKTYVLNMWTKDENIHMNGATLKIEKELCFRWFCCCCGCMLIRFFHSFYFIFYNCNTTSKSTGPNINTWYACAAISCLIKKKSLASKCLNIYRSSMVAISTSDSSTLDRMEHGESKINNDSCESLPNVPFFLYISVILQ